MIYTYYYAPVHRRQLFGMTASPTLVSAELSSPTNELGVLVDSVVPLSDMGMRAILDSESTGTILTGAARAPYCRVTVAVITGAQGSLLNMQDEDQVVSDIRGLYATNLLQSVGLATMRT